METLLTVYYDGLCVLCAREINHYKKQTGSQKIKFMDITSDNFDPKIEGVDPFEVHKIMHAKTKDGKILKKIDAFVAIWKILPKYNFLYKLSQNKAVKKLMDLFYVLFAAVRPYLPKRSKAKRDAELCEESPFCDIKNVKNKSKK